MIQIRLLLMLVVVLSVVCAGSKGKGPRRDRHDQPTRTDPDTSTRVREGTPPPNSNGKNNNNNNGSNNGNNGNNGNGRPPTFPGQDRPPEFVNIEDKKGIKNKKHQLPEHVEVKFNMADIQDLTLNLTWNKHISDAAPVFVGPSKNIIRKWTSSRNKPFGMYHDPATKASISVRQNSKNQDTLDYYGNFYHGADEYVLEPADWHSPSQDLPGDQNTEAQPTNVHMVYLRTKKDPEGQYETAEHLEAEPTFEEQYNIAMRGEGQSVPVGDIPQYGVQSLVIIDFALFVSWYERSAPGTEGEMYEETIDNIRFYYAHVFNGVDMRYRSIGNGEFGMYVKLGGYYIATTPDGAPFTQQHLTPGFPHGDIASYGAIETLIDWLYANQGDLIPFDQATLYTSDYLISGYSGNRILGLAKIEGVCSSLNVALNRDQGLYSATETGAHEMGHNVGALHDGADNECNSDDQFIMAVYPSTLTDEIYRNAFTFSPCSVREIKDFMDYLTSQNRNCLLDPADTVDDIDIEAILETLPGELFTPDQQCQIIFGEQSYFCGGATEEKQICRLMECFHPIYRYCYSTVEMRGATGTSCGDRKWCYQGDCVYSPDAAPGPDYCIYGDYAGSYANGLSCVIIREEQPWYCYSDYYLDDCCQSCAQIEDPNTPGCEYGDKDGDCSSINTDVDCLDTGIRERCCETCDIVTEPGNPTCNDQAPWCSPYITAGYFCYGGDLSEYCCSTCEIYKTDITSCEYGDREDCSSRSARECYDLEDACCQTCHELQVSPDGSCKYGDRQHFCIDITPSSCYIDDVTCCDQCRKYDTGDTDCRYGDRITGCTLSHCETATGRLDCCNTCQTYVTVPTTTIIPDTTTPRPDEDCRDHADWCEGLHSSRCYVESDRETCCLTCSRYYIREAVGCEYGDGQTWCRPIYCSSVDLRQTCCSTCGEQPTVTTAATTPYVTPTAPAPGTTPAPTPTPSECDVEDEYWCSSRTVYECYVYEEQCCSYCSMFNTGDPECKYGNHATWCEDYVKSPDLCTDYVIGQCCQTCRDIPHGEVTPFPEAGDELPWPGCSGTTEATWCDTIMASHCYQDDDNCCATCATFWTGQPDCYYGDRATWCENYILDARDCYVEGNTCCESCEPYKTNIHGCEYGDKDPSCSLDMCQYPDQAVDCCLTCSQASLSLHDIGNNDCKGNPPSWCLDIHPSECYMDHVQINCCDICDHYKSSKPGCPYGDHDIWCDSIDAVMLCPFYEAQCCLTCS